MANVIETDEMVALRMDLSDALASAERHRQAWLDVSEKYHALKAQVDALAQRYKWFPTEPRLLSHDAANTDPDALVKSIDAVIAYSKKEAADGERNGAYGAFAVAQEHFYQMENLGEIDERTLVLVLNGLNACKEAF